MKGNWKEPHREKTLFKTVYCLECKQIKTCGKLNSEYCCSCAYQMEQERTQEYSDYEKLLANKQKAQKARTRQLKLLWDYGGCRKCGSYAVDAYELYENNQLVCWSCLIKKEGRASGSVSFLGQQKWYKKCWKIELREWLTTNCLPTNVNCAKKWLKDRNHLNNCDCLEREAKELYLLLANSLKRCQKKLKECRCETSEKVRINYLNSTGSGWTYCEKCEARIESAGHHGVVKNRNDPRFWGLEIKEKVLCGNCLEERKNAMKPLKRAEFNRYRKKGKL